MSGTLQRGQSVIAGAVPVTGDPKHMTVVMLLGPSQRPQTLWWDLSWSAAPPLPPWAPTWKVCWGCWGPKHRSEQACGCHREAESVSHSVACGCLQQPHNGCVRTLCVPTKPRPLHLNPVPLLILKASFIHPPKYHPRIHLISVPSAPPSAPSSPCPPPHPPMPLTVMQGCLGAIHGSAGARAIHGGLGPIHGGASIGRCHPTRAPRTPAGTQHQGHEETPTSPP